MSGLVTKRFRVGAICILLLPVVPLSMLAQTSDYSLFWHPSSPARNESGSQGVPASELATILGTVTGAGATVSLNGPNANDVRTVTTSELGFFELADVAPGISYRVTVSATGFERWESPLLVLQPGQREHLDVDKLRIEELRTTVMVTPETSNEIAIQQVKVEEKQRGLGIIPNFFTAYNPNPAPLTAKLKFDLAFRVLRDPFTLAGVALIAGGGQAAGNRAYVQGARGYGERFGSNYANQLTAIMVGGAILPSLLHQDPRYFYQGSGTKTSRALHAVSSIFLAKGDNGKTEPNFSSIGGDLVSATISTSYYPEQNEEGKTVLEGFAINTAVHVAVRLLQEFVFRPQKGTVVDDTGKPAGAP